MHTQAKHHQAHYNGKTVTIDYCDSSREFKIACYRITDNGYDGFVLTPKQEVFRITRNKGLAVPAEG